MKLRRGPLPRTETVKVTVALPVALKVDLEHYAQVHAETWGQAVDAAGLIPFTLQAFMERDRGFCLPKGRRQSASVV
jgi:hypothetical protein